MAVSEETSARLAAGVEAALEILGQSPLLAKLVEQLENPSQVYWPDHAQLLRIVDNATNHAGKIYAYFNEDEGAPSHDQAVRLASTLTTCLSQVGALLRGEDLDDTDQVRNAQAWQEIRALESDLRFSVNTGTITQEDIDGLLVHIDEAKKHLRKEH